MAKSIRSKVKKRFRTAKRVLVDATVCRSRAMASSIACSQIARGVSREAKVTLNAFKYPDAPESVVPQVQLSKPFDFRSEALPSSGYATIGNRRKLGSGDLRGKSIVGLDMGGSVRGQFAAMEEGNSVENSTIHIAAAVPIRKDTLPRTVAFAPRRNRTQRKAQRSSAK